MATLRSLIFNICLLFPLINGQCSVEKAKSFFKRSVYEFSIELVTRLAEETDNHFVASTLSPWTLIATVSLGATDDTLAEIKKVLRLHPHQCFNNKFFEIVQKIASSDDILMRSSSLFIDEGMRIKEDFITRIRKTELSNIEKVPFENFADVAITINDYVNRATRGNVNDIVSPSDLEGVYLAFIDALYFSGSWKWRFTDDETDMSPFYDEKGNQIGDVMLMFQQQLVNMARLNQLEAKVLELPYDNDRFSMLFILPNTDIPILKVIDNLKQVSLRTIFNQFLGPQLVSVQIPRFEISSDLDNLKELLVDMGLRTMFDSNLAKFGEISDYSLYISKFIQKARISVTEKGTEASAGTAALLTDRSNFINEFTATKPFLFMLVDRETELILFTGVYSKPSMYSQ